MLEQYRCPNCGGELSRINDEQLKCPCCTSIFEEYSFQQKVRSLTEFLDHAKIEYVHNQRRNLYESVYAKYISKNNVTQYATEIKKLLPDDFQANFYLDALSGDVKKINQLIRAIDVEENYELLAPIVHFLIASLESEYLLELNLLIDRAYKKRDLTLYSRFATALSIEAEKTKEGVYETALPREVFIAYSSKDIKEVSLLCEELEDQGISCFVAARNLRHGVGSVENYDIALQEAMDNCTCFLFVSSPNSRKFDCDAIRKEIPHIKNSDIRNAPAEFCYNYRAMPAKYKKPRIEYRIGAMSKSIADRVTDEFFDGYEWVYDIDGVLERLMQILTGTPDLGCTHIGVADPGIEPTCTEPGRTEGAHCVLCGEIIKAQTIIPPTGHKPGEWQTEKPATHEEDGLRIKKCTVCGEILTEEKIPAQGHDFGSWIVTQKQTCTQNGIQERVCSCGKKETITFPAHGVHQPGEWQTVTEAAPGTEGLRIRKCTSCGEKLNEEKIPALSAAQSVKATAPAAQPEKPSFSAPAAQTAKENLSLSSQKPKSSAPAAQPVKPSSSAPAVQTAKENLSPSSQKPKSSAPAAQPVKPSSSAPAVQTAKENLSPSSQKPKSTAPAAKPVKPPVSSPAAQKAKLPTVHPAKEADFELSMNATEMYDMGEKYYYGQGNITKNYRQAFEWYMQAANYGNDAAQFRLGVCYENGQGVQTDINQAKEWYIKAAAQGNEKAKKAIERLLNGNRNPTASQDLNDTQAIKKTDPSQNEIRNAALTMTAQEMYEKGEKYYLGKGGFKKDYGKAIQLLIQAAIQDHADAQFRVAVCYENGHGVTSNDQTAVEWYTKAAMQGNAEAQNSLGYYYSCGRGVIRDHQKATEWYTKAANQNHVEAQYNLGYCYYSGLGVTKNDKKAVEWYTKAAMQGNAEAQNSLGNCYAEGEGVMKSHKKAVEWYINAANQDHAEAQFRLGYCYEHGHGIAKDPRTAVEWYTKAADKGFGFAQFHLADCYEKGHGVEKDIVKAVEWYKKAAAQGHEKAQQILDRLHNATLEAESTATVLQMQETSHALRFEMNNYLKTCTVKGAGFHKSKHLVIPAEYEGYTVTTIGYGAFGDTDFESIVIPDSVTEIHEEAFHNCTELVSLHYTGKKKQWKHIFFGKDWRQNSSITKVKCADGTIKL